MTLTTSSALGLTWKQKPYDERLALAMQQKFELPSALAQIMAAKHVELDEIENFLNPTIKANLPNPFDLLDMEAAVLHVINAVQARKKITIFADYDVDGATSSALLRRFFREIGVAVEIYVPDRVLEGYGPNSQALLALKKNGTDLVITVDCGTTAFKPLEDAVKAGLEIIVIDHHLGVLEKPAALAVINPNRIDESFLHKNLCAAGVCFLFAVAINKRLREIGFYGNEKNVDENIAQNNDKKNVRNVEGGSFKAKNKVAEPKIMQLLDLVALGTVCDVMPLIGLNRAFVAQGLKILRMRQNLGIRALCDVAGLDEEPSAYHLGFIIGPRINAGGRVGKSDLGARILSTEDEDEARSIAAQLHALNAERKEIETKVLQESIDQLEKAVNPANASLNQVSQNISDNQISAIATNFSANDQIIFAVGNDWHQGVIGIVASRIKDLYNRPTAAISINSTTQIAKASCRSINGIDFGSAILQARLNGLLLEGGGHAMAGGFSMEAAKIPQLQKFFHDLLSEKIAELTKEKLREFHCQLDLQNINVDLLKHIQRLEPYGAGNSRPKFIIRNLRKVSAKIIGQTQEHISCNFSSLSSVGFAGNLQAVAFRSVSTPMANILLDAKFNKPISIAGELNINNWMGTEKVQMIIEDVLI